MGDSDGCADGAVVGRNDGARLGDSDGHRLGNKEGPYLNNVDVNPIIRKNIVQICKA